MYFAKARLISLLAAFLVYRLFSPETTAFYIVCAIAFAHYIISFFSSWKNVVQIPKSRRSLTAAILSLAVLPFMIKTQQPDVFICFGIHMALSDGYLMRRKLESQGIRLPEHHFFMTCMTSLSLYLLFFRMKLVEITGFSYPLSSILLFGLCLASYCVFFIHLFRQRHAMEPSLWIPIFAFEVVGFIIMPGAIILGRYIFWEAAVLYHVLFWFFIPFAKPDARKNIFRSSPFLMWHIPLALLFLTMTPIFKDYWPTLSHERVDDYLTNWGYFHITTSLVLSALNPRWLLRLANIIPSGVGPHPVRVETSV